jgi:ankyrin repeat protein
VLCFRCLCLAGCNINQKNSEGIKAEITALKYGYNDIGDLLSRLRNVCVPNARKLLHIVKIRFNYNGKNSYQSRSLPTYLHTVFNHTIYALITEKIVSESCGL